MEDLYKHIAEENGHSVAYAQVGLYPGLNVSSCLNIARHASLSSRRIRLTNLKDKRGGESTADARNKYSLLSLGVRRGDVLRIEVCGNDHIARDLAHRLHSALIYEGISVHL